MNTNSWSLTLGVILFIITYLLSKICILSRAKYNCLEHEYAAYNYTKAVNIHTFMRFMHLSQRIYIYLSFYL